MQAFNMEVNLLKLEKRILTGILLSHAEKLFTVVIILAVKIYFVYYKSTYSLNMFVKPAIFLTVFLWTVPKMVFNLMVAVSGFALWHFVAQSTLRSVIIFLWSPLYLFLYSASSFVSL